MSHFEIKFDFPVAFSNLKISFNATAELHHSDPYFVVHDFYFTNSKKENEHHSILPSQEVKRIIRDGSYLWVHKDSEQVSELSIAIGKGIENILSKEELDRLSS